MDINVVNEAESFYDFQKKLEILKKMKFLIKELRKLNTEFLMKID